jgi:hypothetical protein
VYIDDEQFAWFEQVLAANKERPVVVFTHAPPMGCGLKVVENVHVKNRCAFLNHSDRPQRFIRLVEANSNIKLWFSGHFHLSQVGFCSGWQTAVWCNARVVLSAMCSGANAHIKQRQATCGKGAGRVLALSV